MNRTEILLSVRPRYAAKILSGNKTIELRRVRPKVGPGDGVIMYVSAPRCEIQALLHVEEIIECSPTELWRRERRSAAITEDEFREYFRGARSAIGIRVHVDKNLREPISLADIRTAVPGFTPPQSYRYVDGAASELRALLAPLRRRAPHLCTI